MVGVSERSPRRLFAVSNRRQNYLRRDYTLHKKKRNLNGREKPPPHRNICNNPEIPNFIIAIVI